MTTKESTARVYVPVIFYRDHMPPRIADVLKRQGWYPESEPF